MKKIKILVNAIPLTKVLTGIGRVLKSLYCELEKNNNLEIWYFNGSSLTNKMPMPKNNKKFNKLIPIIWKLPPYFSYNIRCIIQNFQQKKFFKISENFDIYHELGYFPFKTNKKVKTVFTVHDMSLISNPEWHPEERVKFFKKYWKMYFNYADFFVTPSKFSKNELTKYYPIPDSKISVIPWGCDKKVFYKRSEKEIKKVKKKFKIEGDYFLYVGTIEPRKNIMLLINAFSKIKEKNFNLVIAGWTGWEKKKLSSIKNVIFTGHVSDNELASLYSGAISLILLSSYEGFGLPLIEAINCGTLVICSDIPVFREIFSDKSVKFVNLSSEKEIINAIEMIYKTNDRKIMLENAMNDIKNYSWEKCANYYLQLFLKILE